MDDKRVRVRLKFQEPGILKSQQIEQGLAQSWYLVLLEDVHTIADVAYDIRSAFHLEESCPNGLSLVVRIYKVRRTENQGLIAHEPWNDHVSSKDWLAGGLEGATGYHGVELRALDEFEKETGGYESEQEEGEMETDLSLDSELRAVKEAKPSPSRKKEKGRGRKKYQRTNNVVSEVGKLGKTKDSKGRQELAILQVNDKSNSALSHGKLQGLGVESHCSDELEKETGTDKEEENVAGTVGSGKGKLGRKKSHAASESTHSDQERRGRKRKTKDANIEGQGHPQKGEMAPSTNGVQCAAELSKDGDQKVKRKKLNHSRSHPVGADVQSIETGDKLQVELVEADREDGPKEGSSRKKKKRKDISSINGGDDVREGMSTKKTAVDKVKEKKRKKEAALECPTEKLRTRETRANEGSIPARAPKSKANGESTPAKASQNETNTQQRPSRSARRKKAKRQWLREQAKMAENTGAETHVSESNGSKFEIVLGQPDSIPVVEEIVEVEAEEEVLPIVVRRGHIRFEPYSTDETPDDARPSMPAILLGDQVKTKRQGQNWGQERSAEKHNSKGWRTETSRGQSPEVSGDTRVNTISEHQMDPASLEKHPALDGTPQEGDVLAYRLVELTTSWTPEISPYRVGIVAHWEGATNIIKVDPHPDYLFLGKKDSLEDEEDVWSGQEMEVDGPYDENGVLEIEFSSLVEVRLMQRVHSKSHNVVPSPSVETEKELGPTTAGDHIVDNPITETITDMGQGAEARDSAGAPGTSAWQDLVSEELERKKMELCQRDGVGTSASIGTMEPSEQPENGHVGSEGGTLVNQPKSGRSRKFKFLKSAGVGSIVALLRAQQAL